MAQVVAYENTGTLEGTLTVVQICCIMEWGTSQVTCCSNTLLYAQGERRVCREPDSYCP